MSKPETWVEVFLVDAWTDLFAAYRTTVEWRNGRKRTRYWRRVR